MSSETIDKHEKLVRLEIIDRDGALHMIHVPPDIGLNLMEVCKSSELHMEGICGGIALCGSCHAYILSDHKLDQLSPAEDEMLDKLHTTKANSRLCCQIRVNEKIDGLKIKLAPE